MNIQDIKKQVIGQMSFAQLNEIQEKMLATVGDRQNVLLLAPTGSGKTVAFLSRVWALMEAVPQPAKHALVIAPSRELVQQIAEVWQKLHTGIRCVATYGGHDLRTEQSRLQDLGTERSVIVGTPGRVKDHIERGNIAASLTDVLVIDEFDKSLELGFEEEMHAIIDTLTGLQRRILTSATHAVPIAPWTGFSDYDQIEADLVINDPEQEEGRLEVYQVKSPIPDKLETLRDLLLTIAQKDRDAERGGIIVFANYREAAERIAHYLSEEGIDSALYHGGLDQEFRDKAIIRFRGQSIALLVSTDLASRGLDIPEVAHVIHYHLPQSEEAWTHRNGRTARAGASGASYIILGPNEILPEFVDSPNGKLPYYQLAKDTSKGRQMIASPNVTVYIGRGKKEKISKGDVVGFFTKNGGLQGSDLGRIDVLDHCAYVAIRRSKAEAALAKVKGLKIKGEKTHYLIVSGT